MEYIENAGQTYMPVFGGNGVQINLLDLGWFPFVPCDLRVQKIGQDHWEYITENGPVCIE